MTPRETTTSTGAWAEAQAEAYLVAEGMRCVARNYRAAGGELDRVMLCGETLVFIEVRMRKRSRYGGAIESITPTKQRRIALAAERWRLANPDHGKRLCRFDVVAVSGTPGRCEVEWRPRAFTLG